MLVNITKFLEDPHIYVVRHGRGAGAFEWLVHTLGIEITVHLFSAIIYSWITEYYVSATEFPTEVHEVGGKWVSAEDITSIATWAHTPQGGLFWAALEELFLRVRSLTPAMLEDLRNKAYLLPNKP